MKVPEWTEVASVMVEFGDTYDVLICLSGPPLFFFLCGSHLQMGALEQRQGAQSPMGPHLDFSWPGDITTQSLSRLPDNVIF